jgi:hypothetical protein
VEGEDGKRNQFSEEESLDNYIVQMRACRGSGEDMIVDLLA